LALPTILLFHNSKPVSKFNHTNFSLENYSQFISTLTGIEASGHLEVLVTISQNLFSPALTLRTNKLECLSLASL
jgi:hypothetical protein